MIVVTGSVSVGLGYLTVRDELARIAYRKARKTFKSSELDMDDLLEVSRLSLKAGGLSRRWIEPWHLFASAELVRARVSGSWGHLPALREALLKALSRSPCYAYSIAELAKIEEKLGNSERAERCRELALELAPRKPEVLEGVGRLYLELWSQNSSEEYLKKGISCFAELIALLSEKTAEVMNELEEAGLSEEEIVSRLQRPNNSHALFLYFYRRNKLELGREVALKIPEEERTHYEEFIILLEKIDSPESARIASYIISRFPSRDEGFKWLCKRLDAYNVRLPPAQWEKVAGLLSYPRALLRAASAYTREGESERAKSLLKRYLKEHSLPEHEERYVLYRVAFLEGDYARAEEHIRRAIELFPGQRAEYFASLGYALMKQERYFEARRQFLRAIHLQRRNREWRQALKECVKKIK